MKQLVSLFHVPRLRYIHGNHFEDFYRNARYIKYRFNLLSLRDRQIYKMYVYSNSIIKIYVLDKMWEYLNEPMGSCYYVSYDMLGEYL